jgi:hypothetical protein
VLAVRSHFLEFLDPEAPDQRPRLAHELETGRSYEVVMSTGAGFLRYRIGDRVRVEGRCRETPCVRFEGRADAVSDLVGEKLSAARVGEALTAALAFARIESPRFSLLAPEWAAPPWYALFLESEASDEALDCCAAHLEATLCEGHSYSYARSLGQLGPVRAVRVHGGAHRFETRRVALGQRAGDVKPAELDATPGWQEWMTDGSPRLAAAFTR